MESTPKIPFAGASGSAHFEAVSSEKAVLVRKKLRKNKKYEYTLLAIFLPYGMKRRAVTGADATMTAPIKDLIAASVFPVLARLAP